MEKEFSIGMKGEGQKQLAPEGLHPVEVIDVKFISDEKSGSGKAYFFWKLETVEERIPLEVRTTTTKEKRWLLKQLLSACGIEAKEGDEEERYNFDREDVIGKIVLANIEHRENTFTGREGNQITFTKAEVKGFEKLEVEEELNPMPLAEKSDLVAGEIINRILALADKQDITIKGIRKKIKKWKPKFDIEKGLLTELNTEELLKLENEIKNEVPFGNE